MKTIETETSHEIIIKNSRFIAHLYQINQKEEVEDKINHLKQKYKDATHFCYAYRFPHEQKASDDAEPSGTAGIPILKVLEKQNLYYTLAVVVRYFGGIKLGAGGLVRAYTKAVTETLKQTKTKDLIEGYQIELTFPYEKQKKIDYLLKEQPIINKIYKEQITYLAKIDKQILPLLLEIEVDYHIIESCFL